MNIRFEVCMTGNNIYIILGMHRSGTSLLCAGLSYAGLSFGNNLMGATKDNLKGHWEDNDIVSMNNKLLATINYSWDTLGLINEERWTQKNVLNLSKEAKCLLYSKLAENNQSFAFKDPRTIRLLPFWLGVFQEMGIKPNFIFIFRSPNDVCISLAKRENKTFALSQLIWLHHNLDNLNLIMNSEYKVFFLDFFDFCDSPKKQTKNIMQKFNLKVDSDKLNLFENEFYDRSLLSNLNSPYHVSEQKWMLPICFDLYRVLRLVAHGQPMNSELQSLIQVWTMSAELLAKQLNALETSFHEKLLSHMVTIKENEAEISRLHSQFNLFNKISELQSNFSEEMASDKELVKQIGNEISIVHGLLLEKNSDLRIEDFQGLFQLVDKLNHTDEKVDMVLDEIKTNTNAINDKKSKSYTAMCSILKRLRKDVLVQNKSTAKFSEILKSIKEEFSLEKRSENESDAINSLSSLIQDELIRVCMERSRINDRLNSVVAQYNESFRTIEKINHENMIIRMQNENLKLRSKNLEIVISEYKKQKQAFESSISWRITAPFRLFRK